MTSFQFASDIKPWDLPSRIIGGSFVVFYRNISCTFILNYTKYHRYQAPWRVSSSNNQFICPPANILFYWKEQIRKHKSGKCFCAPKEKNAFLSRGHNSWSVQRLAYCTSNSPWLLLCSSFFVCRMSPCHLHCEWGSSKCITFFLLRRAIPTGRIWTFYAWGDIVRKPYLDDNLRFSIRNTM